VIDGKQQKDNHINITQYFECNKATIMDLAEKNYENLVQALTNNAINTVAESFSNSISLLTQSSSRFPNLSNDNDIYRIEESESFHNSKGDIAD
jgi:hypothetical protein